MPPNGLGDDGAAPLPGLGAVKSPKIKRVFNYWIALRRDRLFPAWADVNLMDIYDVAPCVAVLDVETLDGGLRFRYRFCGTALVEARSRLTPSDPTGRCLDEVAWPFDPAPLLTACRRVSELRMPALLAAGAVDENSYQLRERAFFPLGPEDDRVTHVVVCVDAIGAG